MRPIIDNNPKPEPVKPAPKPQPKKEPKVEKPSNPTPSGS